MDFKLNKVCFVDFIFFCCYTIFALRCSMTEKLESSLISSNVFVVSHDDSCIIIDAGVDVDKLKNFIGTKKVLGIFLTHGHYDHCFYVLEYQKLFGCKIYASEQIKQYLENPDFNYSEGKLKIDDFSSFVFLKNEGAVDIESFSVEFHQLGGHSKSDMVFLVDGEIFVGDLLIGRDMGRIDLIGGNKLEMKRSLEYLVKTDYVVMHSGHGEDHEKKQQDAVAKLWIKFLSR